MKVDVGIVDFSIPECVIVKSAPAPRQNGFKDQMTLPLQQIDEITLSKMCDKFREDIFKKAGKRDPNKKLWPGNIKGVNER